jgi:hypothetical protein
MVRGLRGFCRIGPVNSLWQVRQKVVAARPQIKALIRSVPVDGPGRSFLILRRTSIPRLDNRAAFGRFRR